MRGAEEHELLIERTIYYLRKLGYTNFDRGKKIPMERYNYYVDVLAYENGKPVPVECGTVTDDTRIPELLQKFEKLIHVGFSGHITVLTADMGLFYFRCSFNYGKKVEKTEFVSKKLSHTFEKEVVSDNYWWEI